MKVEIGAMMVWAGPYFGVECFGAIFFGASVTPFRDDAASRWPRCRFGGFGGLFDF